jgi:nitronate monooxygenase
MFKTRMTELFGIEVPIQCGTMQTLSRAELVAAVANAGALACLPAATFLTPEELLQEIERTRELTDKPFGVNLPLIYPQVADHIQIIIDEGVKVEDVKNDTPGCDERERP